MVAKIWIASKPVGISTYDTGYDHLYVVYDPDGDPTTGDEQFFRAGPSAGNISIEQWVSADKSDDSHYDPDTGEMIYDPFVDRNFTELASGSAADAIKDDLSDWAGDLGTPDVDGFIQTSIPYTIPFQIGSPENRIPALNSNTTIVSGLNHAGVDAAANMPYVGGDPLNGRMSAGTHAGYESYYTASDGTVNLDGSKNQIVYSVDGNNTYVIDVNSFDQGRIIIVEDTNASTTDKIVLNNVDPEDVHFRRTLFGDLEIYLPGDPSGEPSIIIKDQWDVIFGVPRMDEIWVVPEGGTPSVIPLNDRGDFPLFSPQPLPGWVTGAAGMFHDGEAAVSPIVLDIDMSGTIDLAALNGAGSVYWDIDGDGFAEASGWIAGGEAANDNVEYPECRPVRRVA